MVEFWHDLPRDIQVIPDRKVFIANYANGKKVLHVGCVDAGLTLDRIQKQSFLHFMLLEKARKVWGVDINKTGLQTLSELGIRDLFFLNAEDLDTLQLDDSPDLIVASEILEHMPNPGRFLDAAKRFNAELLISVPNAFSYRGIKAILSGKEFVHEDHNYYFSYITLNNLIRKHGYILNKCLVYYWPSDDESGKELIDNMRKNVFFAEGLIFLLTSSPDKVSGREASKTQNLHDAPLVRPFKNRKIVFFAGDTDNFHFVKDIISNLDNIGYETRVVKSAGLSIEELYNHMKWSDIAWFEWANGPIIRASHLPKVCKIICRLHRYEVYSETPKQIKWDNVDTLIFVSHHICDVFKELHFPDIEKTTKVHIIRNAVDLDKFNKSATEKGFNIAYVARVHQDKNPSMMIQIIVKLTEYDRRYRCFIAGTMMDRCLYDYMMKMVKNLGLEENIIYDGVIDNINTWLEDKHFILSTSIVEGHPVNILEAMAKGIKPVIHNYLGDVSDAFDSESVFCTVDEAVELILSDDYKPDKYRNYIESKYDLKNQIEEVSKVIEEIDVDGIVNKSENKLVSVVIPTYNRANYISSAIESCLAQTYQNVEIVVVDDGSEDDTGERVLAKGGSRVRYVRQEHRGAPAARNRGIAEAKGEFILWLDSDDVLMPDAIRRYVETLAEVPDADVLYGNLLVTDERLQVVRTLRYEDWHGRNADLVARMIHESPLPNPGSLIRKSCYERIGGYDESFPRAHDYEWWSRLAKVAKLKHVDIPVLKWRWHNGNMSSGSVRIDTSYEARIVHRMVERNTLRELCPEIAWDRLPNNEAEAIAYLRIAMRLVSLRDISGGLSYVEKSYGRVPSAQVKELLRKLRESISTQPANVEGIEASQYEMQRTNRLRLLLVSHDFPPRSLAGTELYTYNLAQEFRQRGHAVRVLYPECNTQRPEGDITEDIYEGIPVTRLNLHPNPDMTRQFQNEPIAEAFGHYLASLEVDVVHFQHLIGLSASALQISTRQGVPTLLTLHDGWSLCEQWHFLQPDGRFCVGPETVDKCVQCLVERLPQQVLPDKIPVLFYILALRRQVVREALAGLDALVVPSQFLLRTLRAYNFEHPHTVIAPLGLPAFSPLPRQPNAGPLRFTFLGNITFTKGVDVAIRAFNLIDPDKARLDLYGKASDTAYWQRISTNIKPSHQVEYHGAYDPKDLPEILARTDVAVIPSRAEHYPTVIRECLHAGVPVIGPNVGGVPEIIQDGMNGFLFEPGNHEDLADKLRFFVDNPGQVQALRQRIQPVWTITEDATQLEALYHDILSRKSIRVRPETAVTPTPTETLTNKLTNSMDRNAHGSQESQKRQYRGELGFPQQQPLGGRPECSIIIPVFNKVELTKQCLTHLAQVTQNVEYEVIVLDNASSDGTQEFLASLSGDVQVIRNEENLGFAKACNQGARAARGCYLVFLNNDTIPLAGWLQAMVEEVKTHPDVAVVGSKLLYPNDTIQHAGVVFSRSGSIPYHLYNGLPGNASAVNRRRELQAVTGACMLVRREVFEATGGFDEGYHNGFEDIDFCLKVRGGGWRIIYQPNSRLYHLESQTPGRKDHDADNMRRFVQRWTDRWLVDEDTVYVPDGYTIHEVQEHGRKAYQVVDLKSPEEIARWERVAEIERLGQAGNMEAVCALLAQPDLWPHDSEVLRWAAQICVRADVPAYAEAFWRQALEFGATPDVLVALTRISLEKGALDKAEQYLQALSTQFPTHQERWLLQGILTLQRQDFLKAKTAFEAALRYDRHARKAQKGLGMAAMGLGQMETAWNIFAAMLADEIDDAEAIHCLLRIGVALERWQSLTEYLPDYLALNPGDLAVRFALAGVQVRLGDWDGARETYETIRLLDPTFAGLDDLALILERRSVGVRI